MPKRTPLYDTHRGLGARFTVFGGWDMPVQYTGIVAEHRAVRARAGLFDLSHMGEIEVCGSRALAVCQELLVTDVARLADGQAQYSLMCDADGGIVDDVLIYRLGPERYSVCVNAACCEADFAWWDTHNRGRAELIDRSAETALVALQGPRAAVILQRLTPLDVSALRRYWSAQAELAGTAGLVARTGYTGEDGFELFVPAEHAAQVWTACLAAGRADGLVPVGLGARDTLWLEAGYVLYGQDMDRHVSPFEAGLSRLVHVESGAFIGRSALVRQKERGVTQKLLGLRMEERGIPRSGYRLGRDGRVLGHITSGTQSPSLGVGIGLGYGPPEMSPGTELWVEIRSRQVRARVVKPPFYRRSTE